MAKLSSNITSNTAFAIDIAKGPPANVLPCDPILKAEATFLTINVPPQGIPLAQDFAKVTISGFILINKKLSSSHIA